MHGGLQASELHDQYAELEESVYEGRALTPVSKRSRRRVLRKLVDYELIIASCENRDRRYEPADAAVQLPEELQLSVPTNPDI